MTFTVTLVSFVLLALAAVPLSGFEQSVVDFLAAVPTWLDFLWKLGVANLIGWTLAVLGVAALRRRTDVLLDVVVASVIALGLGMWAAKVINGPWPDVSDVVTGGPSGTVPLATLAMGATATYAASVHLTAPYRRFGWWAIAIGATSAAILGGTTPLGALLSLLLGGTAASLTRLILGADAGRASPAEVTDSLALLGVEACGLTLSPHHGGGVTVMNGESGDGGPLRVKVYGRDARDSQVMARIWRTLWYRGAGPATGSRVQLVEHEAFVTLFAAARGIEVSSVVMAGLDDRKDAILAVLDASVALPECDRDRVTDSLPAIWQAVHDLHVLGIAHRGFNARTFGLNEQQPTFRDLESATMTSDTDDVHKDRAQVLVMTAVLVGVERAAVAAGEQLGADGVEAMLPYLQVAALGAALRRELKAAEFDMDALRSAAAAVVDVEVPEVAKLQRVSPQALVAAGLLALVGFALIASLTSIDLDELWNELSGASPGWVVAALVVAQLPFLTQAVATRGATPQPVPLGPLALLQSGIAFVALAVPSTAGRLALDIRFFQRLGIPAASAVSISAIDGFSGFLVQIMLLIVTLGFGLGDVELSFTSSGNGGSGDLALVLAIGAAVVVILGLMALALRKVRQRLIDRVKPTVTEVLGTVRSLKSAKKLLELFGGNLANQIVFALALGLCLEAFGGNLNLASLVVVYVAAALFGGLMPVPGGIGVMEAALTTGLVAAGIDTTTATATALLFRLVTFYLPPLWGWFALRWLRNHDYL